MKTNVLVLNQDYTPLSICSAQRAFVLVFLNKADTIHSYEDANFRTISDSFSIPSVIKINRYINVPYKGVTLTRQNIFKRDRNRCQYCGSTKDLTIDHIHPRSKGGKTTWKNVVTACSPCNSAKSDLSIEKAGMTLAKQPFKPSPFFYLTDKTGKLREEWKSYFGKGFS